jgi:hypothetical protein
VDAVQFAGNQVYWIEGRASGDVLVRSRGSGGVADVLPPGVSVASYVHDYGGGAYLATDDAVWFVRADDQQSGGPPRLDCARSLWRLSTASTATQTSA